jgi:hypothetical protein
MRAEDEQHNGSNPNDYVERRRTVRQHVEDFDPGPLRPPVPGDACAKCERSADDDEASSVQPQLFTPSGKEQFGELYGDEDNPNTLETEGP